ncbi:MAG TPA: nickel-dependent hydrogenase large subunit [Spirochaetia bacterium]|nr:nickel-dependent hydrogenase large subunit [Spirochaetia bacterium]
MPRITIDPVTRLEGHGQVEIFLDDEGNVANAYLQVPELRGFEKFVAGRPVEELPRIVTRLCGICPGAHHICSAKGADAVFQVQPPPPAVKLRELFYCAHFLHSHIAHLYLLAAPDLIMGEAGPADRNFPGLVERMGR